MTIITAPTTLQKVLQTYEMVVNLQISEGRSGQVTVKSPSKIECVTKENDTHNGSYSNTQGLEHCHKNRAFPPYAPCLNAKRCYPSKNTLPVLTIINKKVGSRSGSGQQASSNAMNHDVTVKSSK